MREKIQAVPSGRVMGTALCILLAVGCGERRESGTVPETATIAPAAPQPSPTATAALDNTYAVPTPGSPTPAAAARGTAAPTPGTQTTTAEPVRP